VYSGRLGTPVTALYSIAEITVQSDNYCGMVHAMTPKTTSFTYKLTPEQVAVLTDILKHGNYKIVRVEHTTIAVEIPNCRVNMYKSGKCLVQGKEAEDFVTFVLEPFVLGQAGIGYEKVLNPEAYTPHMGVDESGKGDFFGPMVVASAYVDQELANTLVELGVRDSKTITSEKKMLTMARDIRQVLDGRFALVKIGPEAYNRLYAKFRNLNNMLAWAHARAIENLLEKVPGCPRAISDQFGKKELIEKALLKKGGKIELQQMHKAESDVAVAAASILARDDFVRSLKRMEETAGMKLPKGASAGTKKAAVDLIKKNGPAILLTHAKCHFKTTDDVLSETSFKRADVGENATITSQPFGRKFSRKPKKPS
jgi:ribonuclease HIII